MSKFKLEFTLKQHTPLIHFQSDQTGATLRATELKPKLDRFLIRKKVNIPISTNSNGAKSLKYKVKISINSNVIEDIEKRNPRTNREIRNPLFFGNMGDSKEAKKRFVISNKIKIEFFSFDATILEVISNNFEAFLASTNFGTRQSKGFGNFYIKAKSFNPSLVGATVYSFESSMDRYQENINLFYSFLRSGINIVNFRTKESKFYAKALSFMYAKSKGITWDKKVIKQEYFHRDLLQQQNQYKQNDNCVNFSSEKKYLIRDLFGLSSEQSWMSYRSTISKEHKENNKDKKIDRFKSPITFKPMIENSKVKVYFWANDSVENILNKKFIIKNNQRGNLELSTPDEFSFEEFFKFSFALDISSHIETNHNTKEYKTLSAIFTKLRSQL